MLFRSVLRRTRTHGQSNCHSTGEVNGVPVYGGGWFCVAISIDLVGGVVVWCGDTGKAKMPSGRLAFATKRVDLNHLMAARV